MNDPIPSPSPSPSPEALAFDYSSQRWVRGRQAIAVRQEQIADELTLLESSRGAEYLKFVGSVVPIMDAIASLRREQAELEAR